MGIHASDNVSEYAHRIDEPRVREQYDYDQYVIMENHRIIEMFDMDNPRFEFGMWNAARARFLHLFNVEKRQVRLVGRVFN